MAGPVAITGATGFVGQALCRALAQQGRRGQALVRRESPLPAGIEPIRGDLNQPRALQQLLDGADMLIHCAGAVRGATRLDFDAVNVDGTRNLLETAAALPRPPRIVHVSTLAAREPDLSHYAASKRAGEALYDDYPGPWTIVRPTAVYGPGDRELLPLLQAMARGLVAVPRVPAMRITLIHVDDLIAALLAAASAPASRRSHELSDARQEGYSWGDIIQAVSTHSGRKIRRLEMPRKLLAGAARLNASLARTLGRSPMLTPGKVRELTHPDWRTDMTDFMAATDWAPEIDLPTGLATILPGRR